MSKHNNRRLYVVILGLAGVGLILDRTLLSDSGLGPGRAAASQADGTGGATGVATERPAERPPAGPNATAVLVKKLRELEQASSLDLTHVADAYHLAGEEPAAPAGAAAADDRAAAFLRSHQLNAILGAGASGAAVVDGVRVAAGERLDGFTLVSVHTTPRDEALEKGPASAVFESENVRVEIRIPPAPLATRKKASSPEPGAQPGPGGGR